MADLVVYGVPLSPFVRKVQAVLGHAGADYDLEPVNIMAMPDWFLEISPSRRIPVLRDKTIATEGTGGTIPDSSAICLFLDRRFDLGLFGQSAYDTGRIAAIEEYADSTIAFPAGMDFFRPIIFPRFSGKESDIETAKKTWTEKFPPLFDFLERTLDGGDYFVGGAFSLADIAVGSQLSQIDLVAGMPDASKWPALVKHTEAMKQLPGFKENLEASAGMLSAILPEKLDLN